MKLTKTMSLSWKIRNKERIEEIEKLTKDELVERYFHEIKEYSLTCFVLAIYLLGCIIAVGILAFNGGC